MQGNFGNIHYVKKNAPKSSTGADSRNICDSVRVHHFIITVNSLNVHLFFFVRESQLCGEAGGVLSWESGSERYPFSSQLTRVEVWAGRSQALAEATTRLVRETLFC